MLPYLPISILHYCDGPRLFVVRHARRVLLFNCLWDESGDDYIDRYEVLLLPPETRDEEFTMNDGEWVRHAHDRWVGMAVSRLATVPFHLDRFDISRQYVEAAWVEAVAGPAS